mgnify:CR=1 FL=1
MPKRKRGPKQTAQQKRDAERVRRAMNATAERQCLIHQQETHETLTARRAADAERHILILSPHLSQETPETAITRRAADAERQRLSLVFD